MRSLIALVWLGLLTIGAVAQVAVNRQVPVSEVLPSVLREQPLIVADSRPNPTNRSNTTNATNATSRPTPTRNTSNNTNSTPTSPSAASFTSLSLTPPSKQTPIPVIIPDYNYWTSIYSTRYNFKPTDPYRILLFNKNVKEIQEHNRGNFSYKMGINQFSLLTQEEYEQFCLGEREELRRRERNVRTVNVDKANIVRNLQTKKVDSFIQSNGGWGLPIDIPPPPFYIPIPPTAPSWDWRLLPSVLTPIKDQGNCASCYAFAVTAVVQSMLMISRQIFMADLSEQQLVDCSTIKGNYGCGGGARYFAFQYLRDEGLVKESMYLYSGVQENCKNHGGQYKIDKIEEYQGCGAIRKAVRRGPVAVGVDARSWSKYASGLLSCSAAVQVNHAVVLVGYTVEGHWIVKNSYGMSWGENGYAKIDKNADCLICQYSGIGADLK